VANELAELENRQFANIAQSLLPFATDVSLDLLGEIFGVPRLPQMTASVAIADLNFQFYVRNGTFGSINSGQDINIPQGVRIYSSLYGLTGPVYIANAVTLPAAASSMSFSALYIRDRPGMRPPESSRCRTSPTIPRVPLDRCW
jgi:hypothetical protein